MERLVHKVLARAKCFGFHCGAIVRDELILCASTIPKRLFHLAYQHIASVDAKVWSHNFYSKQRKGQKALKIVLIKP